MPFTPARLTRLADDFNETVQRLTWEFSRDGLTERENDLIGQFRQLGNRLEFEVAMGDYAASLARIDPYVRRGGELRRGLETGYRIDLPALPGPLPALGDGETD